MEHNFNFTEEERAQIKEAVKKIEEVSSGEVVVYFAQQSDDYTELRWFTGSFFMMTGAVIIAALSYFWLLPFAATPVEISICLLALFLLGYGIVRLIPGTIRLLASPERLHTRTMQRAAEVFLNEEVFKTRDRTGILIFTSYLEHQVHLLADKGINTVISNDQWSAVVQEVITGIKNKNITSGLVKGIGLLEKPLMEHGIHVKPDDENELPDDIRVE